MSSKAVIVIAGDIFPFPVNEEYFKNADTQKLVDNKILDLFKNADYSVCNLEGCLFDGDAPNKKSGVRLKASPDCINGYKAMGIDCVSFANNHATDFGPEGFFSTLEAVEKAGMDTVGDCENTEKRNTYKSLDINGVKIALYAVSEELFNAPTKTEPGANIYEEYRVCKEIEELKKSYDHVLVLYHGGQEHYQYRDPQMKERFHNMVDAGASFITSQHTHVIGLEETYKGAYLLYGQGNTLFNYVKNPTNSLKEGIILEITAEKDSIAVKKHLVSRNDPGIVYSKDQSFYEFNKRSKLCEAGETFEDEFHKHIYSAAKKRKLFESMRGKNENDSKKSEENPKKFYEYLRSSYSLNQLYKLKKFFEMDEFREIAITAIDDLIKEKEETNSESGKTESDSEHLSGYDIDYKKFGCRRAEYFVYGFAEKTEEEKAEYITSGTARYRFYHLTENLSNRNILKDKNATYKALKDFFNRDAVQRDDREAFLKFAQKHSAFVCKPSSGTGGKGIMFADLNELKISPEEYFDKYLNGKGYDVEELIIQDEAMAKFHPQSINTVRPVTFCRNGEVKFLFAIMRMGLGDSKVDNLSSGGICVAVDPDTGKIISGAVNRTNLTPIETHPDTGIVFQNESIPYWEELKETVKKAAKAFPDPPIIGWDMALGQNGWTIVEANWQPTLREFQMLTGKGLRERFERLTGESFAPNPAGYTGDDKFDTTGKRSKKKSKESKKKETQPVKKSTAVPASYTKDEPKKGFFASLFKK